MTQMTRNRLTSAFASKDFQHPGLLFTRGLIEKSSENNQDSAEFLSKVADSDPSAFYKEAWKRWQLLFSGQNFAEWCGKLIGRLYLGTGEAHFLETNIMLHHSYGMPYIPGSSLKGLARSYARGLYSAEVMDILFGTENTESDDVNNCNAGYLIFHDAWWIPNQDKPFALEIITVHHQNYYTKKGEKPASEMDSPIPNAQLTAQGSFYFVIEGEKAWADLAMKILCQALTTSGAGAKTSSGYGYFEEDRKALGSIEGKRAEKQQEILAAQKAAAEERRFHRLSPLEQKIEKVVKETRGSDQNAQFHVLLYKALIEQNKFDEAEKKEVALKLKAIMIQEKVWKETTGARNPDRDRNHQYTLKVMQLLP